MLATALAATRLIAHPITPDAAVYVLAQMIWRLQGNQDFPKDYTVPTPHAVIL